MASVWATFKVVMWSLIRFPLRGTESVRQRLSDGELAEADRGFFFQGASWGWIEWYAAD